MELLNLFVICFGCFGFFAIIEVVKLKKEVRKLNGIVEDFLLVDFLFLFSLIKFYK